MEGVFLWQIVRIMSAMGVRVETGSSGSPDKAVEIMPERAQRQSVSAKHAEHVKQTEHAKRAGRGKHAKHVKQADRAKRAEHTKHARRAEHAKRGRQGAAGKINYKAFRLQWHMYLGRTGAICIVPAKLFRRVLFLKSWINRFWGEGAVTDE